MKKLTKECIKRFIENVIVDESFQNLPPRVSRFVKQTLGCPVYQYKINGEWFPCFHIRTARGVRYFVTDSYLQDLDGIALQVLSEEKTSKRGEASKDFADEIEVVDGCERGI